MSFQNNDILDFHNSNYREYDINFYNLCKICYNSNILNYYLHCEECQNKLMDMQYEEYKTQKMASNEIDEEDEEE
jgi:C4-type Zn-finger protein